MPLTCWIYLKTQNNTDKPSLTKKIYDAEKKIPDTSGFLKETDYNKKINEIEGKIIYEKMCMVTKMNFFLA